MQFLNVISLIIIVVGLVTLGDVVVSPFQQLAQVDQSVQVNNEVSEELIRTAFNNSPPPLCAGVSYDDCGDLLKKAVAEGNMEAMSQLENWLRSITGFPVELIDKILNELRQAPLAEITAAEATATATATDEPSISAQDIEDLKKTIKELKRRIKEIVRDVKKYGSPANQAELSRITAEVDRYQTIFSSGNLGQITDARQDFWDVRWWEELDELNRKATLPREIVDMRKSLSRAQKLLAKEQGKRLIQTALGFNLGSFELLFNEVKTVVDQADAQIKAGDFQEAEETLQENIHEPNHQPNRFEWTLNELNNMAREVKRVKNAAIQDQVRGLLQEQFSLIYAGNFRETEETFGEVRDNIFKIIEQARKTKKK